MQHREMGLGPGPRAYHTAVRSGVGNAYLAASVIGSSLVSASKVGAMGKVGAAGIHEGILVSFRVVPRQRVQNLRVALVVHTGALCSWI